MAKIEFTILVLSWVGCILTALILLPQVIKSLITKSTNDINVLFPIINITSNIFWILAVSIGVAFGVKNDMAIPLLVVNSLSASGAIILLILKIINKEPNYYKKLLKTNRFLLEQNIKISNEILELKENIKLNKENIALQKEKNKLQKEIVDLLKL